MIGASKRTVPLLDDAVDVLSMDIYKPDDIVSFLTTPLPPLHRPNPNHHGAASELWLTQLIL